MLAHLCPPRPTSHSSTNLLSLLLFSLISSHRITYFRHAQFLHAGGGGLPPPLLSQLGEVALKIHLSDVPLQIKTAFVSDNIMVCGKPQRMDTSKNKQTNKPFPNKFATIAGRQSTRWIHEAYLWPFRVHYQAVLVTPPLALQYTCTHLCSSTFHTVRSWLLTC